MRQEEYRRLWKEAIHLCEIEPNKEEAVAFVYKYYNQGNLVFSALSCKELLLTFVGLVVYEKKYGLHLGSTTPASRCYSELLNKIGSDNFDKEFIFEVGDWAAEYSDNSYIPMDNYRGYGPSQYFAFQADLRERTIKEQFAKQERIAKLRAEGAKKVEEAKKKSQERKNVVQALRNRPFEEILSYIQEHTQPIFYYIELVEDLFKSGTLTDEQKTRIQSMFPTESTRHNKRLRKKIEELY